MALGSMRETYMNAAAHVFSQAAAGAKATPDAAARVARVPTVVASKAAVESAAARLDAACRAPADGYQPDQDSPRYRHQH